MSHQPRTSPSQAGAIVAWISVLLAGACLLWFASSFLYEGTRITSWNGQLLIMTVDTSQKWTDAFAENGGVRGLAMRLQSSAGITDCHALGFGDWGGKSREDGRFRMVGVPLWFPVLLLMLPAVRFLWVQRRQSRRAMRNQCLHCGYDLRSSAGRCPECGTPIPSAPASDGPPARAA